MLSVTCIVDSLFQHYAMYVICKLWKCCDVWQWAVKVRCVNYTSSSVGFFVLSWLFIASWHC